MKNPFECEVCGNQETECHVEEFYEDRVIFECWCPQCRRSWFEEYTMKLAGWTDKNRAWHEVIDWNADEPADVEDDTEVRA